MPGEEYIALLEAFGIEYDERYCSILPQSANIALPSTSSGQALRSADGLPHCKPPVETGGYNYFAPTERMGIARPRDVKQAVVEDLSGEQERMF